ncbi:helix-turn-helix domain-containing protein [Halomarina oriensis]|uniref:Bacterio-opsin activator n=1 Tax=Halomarina oriensis TaxID=671145 RepID=A0A6B0GTZ8_9EURY|nr:helix-turn-helix domain-containing protein [Halomarina oriensis]MWG35188.1 bacterio-opsin activator [Halomarina oriensis]
MILVEFTLYHPTLREALRATPGARLVWEQSHRDGTDHRIIAWVEGEDLDAFEEGLAGDPSVVTFSRKAATDDRRLYQVTIADRNADLSVYPALMDTASVIKRLTATAEGWHFQVAFPDRDSLDTFRAFCETNELRYEVARIYEEEGSTDDDREFGLTEKQRDLLEMATRRGYFDVPREVGLEELAAEAGISHQAASERLRRAQATLNSRALGFDAEEPTPE